MKRSLILTLALILVIAFGLGSTKLYAQKRTDGPEGTEYTRGEKVLDEGRFDIGLDIGTVFLHTATHDNYKTGLAFGTHFEYLLDDFFALNTSFGYSYHGSSAGAGALHNMWFDIGPRGRLLFYPIGLFLSVSPGFVFDNFTGAVNDSAVSFLINFGTGIDFLVHDNINMGMTYKYHLVFDQNAGVTGTADFMSIMLKVDFIF